MKRLLLLLLLTLSPLYLNATVLQLNINGVIGPANSHYLEKGIEEAKKQNAVLLLIVLDTPGGLMTSTREMIQMIANSDIPVVSFVSPKGARAASAGTYLLYASHISAMSPGTNIGAATPAQIGTPSMGQEIKEGNQSEPSAVQKKIINDAMAYIKSLAELNDRNVTWALQAVKEGESLTANEAYQYGVVDILADSIPDLLQKIHGHAVINTDKNITINSKNQEIVLLEPDWKIEFLSIITQPNIAYILLLIAMYGIFFELMNPGSIIPGVIGAISGLIALYALNILPFNYAGLLLIFLGVAFIVAEVMFAGFGILGIGGLIAFVFGSILLFDSETLGVGVSIPLIIALTLVSAGFFMLTAKLYLSATSKRSVAGKEELKGVRAEVTEEYEDHYRVWCHSESWLAVSDDKLEIGQHVEIESVEGLTLKVKPLKE